MPRPPLRPAPGSRSRLPPREPSLLVWLLAAVSLALPWVGLPLAFAGALAFVLCSDWAIAVLVSGIGLIVLDVIIDFVWAGLTAGASDDPTLNRGGTALIGRSVVVIEAIVMGRGKVRAGDTVWIAEGPDAAAGDILQVQAVSGTVLQVGPRSRMSQQPAGDAP